MRDFSKFFPLFVHKCVVSAAHSTGMPKTKCLENSPQDFASLLAGCAAIFKQGGVKWSLMLTDDKIELEPLSGQERSIGAGFKDQFGAALAREMSGELGS